MQPAKSDNLAEIGAHVFERAGLGKAPFRFAGFYECKYQACQGAPIQPGTCCDYCGEGIMYVCKVKSSDGKEFKVGCDCVGRTGDGGLIHSYKNSSEFRSIQAQKRAALNERKRQQLEALMCNEAVRAKLESTESNHHRYPNMLARIEASLPWCGAKGRNDWLSLVKKISA